MKEIKITRKQPNSRMCFACGQENNSGLKSRFFELETGELMAIFCPAIEHQGYPGRLHGGLAATILDETIGRAVMISHADNIWGVTVDFSMRLRKPVPLDSEVRILARITKDSKRFFEGSGEILLADGTIAVEGKGRYLKIDINRITDLEMEEDDWRVIPMPDDPDTIVL
ncbi:PaaI family thioesterase [Desulfolithobacter sp.]